MLARIDFISFLQETKLSPHSPLMVIEYSLMEPSTILYLQLVLEGVVGSSGRIVVDDISFVKGKC